MPSIHPAWVRYQPTDANYSLIVVQVTTYLQNICYTGCTFSLYLGLCNYRKFVLSG